MIAPTINRSCPRRGLNKEDGKRMHSEEALPQFTWDLQIIAAWNTTAQAHLNNQDPIWLRECSDIPKANDVPVVFQRQVVS
eukprot:1138475-Pelagomonas_calceolata.AAC.2